MGTIAKPLPAEKVCIGPCGRTLANTAEHFSLIHKPNGRVYTRNVCRECTNASKRIQPGTYAYRFREARKKEKPHQSTIERRSVRALSDEELFAFVDEFLTQGRGCPLWLQDEINKRRRQR